MKDTSEMFLLNFLCLDQDFKIFKFHSWMVFLDAMYIDLGASVSTTMVTIMNIKHYLMFQIIIFHSYHVKTLSTQNLNYSTKTN